jgi:hypothetical protein
MNNKLVGILILTLYWGNYYICELIYPNDNYNWFMLKFALLSICLLLAIEYKKQGNFIEKLFCAIIFNDIYVLLFNNETNYSLNDIFFIAWFTAIQYIKYFYNLYKQWSKH